YTVSLHDALPISRGHSPERLGHGARDSVASSTNQGGRHVGDSVEVRRRRIAELVDQHGALKVSSLAGLLNVSAITARRDVEALAGRASWNAGTDGWLAPAVSPPQGRVERPWARSRSSSRSGTPTSTRSREGPIALWRAPATGWRCIWLPTATPPTGGSSNWSGASAPTDCCWRLGGTHRRAKRPPVPSWPSWTCRPS